LKLVDSVSHSSVFFIAIIPTPKNARVETPPSKKLNHLGKDQIA